MAKLSDLQNIGKVLEARLVEAGVDTPETVSYTHLTLPTILRV